MAVGTIDNTSLGLLLKEQYLVDAIQNQFNNKAKTLARFKRSTSRNVVNVQGKVIILPLRSNAFEAITTAGENPSLPTSGTAGFNRAEVPLAFQHARAGLTNVTVEAIKTSTGGFGARILATTLRDTIDGMARDADRQICGDGTGALAITLSAVVDGANKVVFVNTTTSGNPFNLEKGMVVDIPGLTGGPYTVDGVNRSAGSFTTTAILVGTATVGGSIVRDPVASLAESYGLAKIINNASATIFNINRGTAGNEWWSSSVDDNSGTLRAITEDLILQAEDDVEEQGDKDGATMLCCRTAVRRQLVEIGIPDKRFATADIKLGGKVEFNSPSTNRTLEIMTDRYIAPNTLYGVCEDDFTIYSTNMGPEFMTEGTQQWFHVSGKPEWELIGFYYFQIACNAPINNWRINDIQV